MSINSLQSHKELMNWRRSELISFSTLLLVASWLWWASARTTAWDQTVRDVKELAPRVQNQGEQMAVLVAAVNDMKDDVKYLRRHASQ